MTARRYRAGYAWLGAGPGGGLVRDVMIEVAGGRFTAVTPGAADGSGADTRLPGLVLPAFANTHSHAFHRALRGRTHRGGGSFWTWRDGMYAVAERLDPDRYLALATAAYAEMALAGVSCVGEFHYLHHGPGGVPYADPNTMSAVLVAAAGAAGIRLTLLDTAYLAATVDGGALTGAQLRFADADAGAWSGRAAAFRAAEPHARLGAAIHSVRAVPAAQLPEVVRWADERDAPLHVHLSEQRAENEACLAHHGRTPTAVLADAGALGPRLTAVHGTHLSGPDITLLGAARAGVCLCPTTERDLGDGIGPATALRDAGSPLTLGTDSHAVVDMFEEARAVELNERLRSERRGHFEPDDLLDAGTAAGHTALGWADAGHLAPGARADLVAVRLDTVRTAGLDPAEVAAGVVFGAVAADVHTVIVDGRTVVDGGRHVGIDVPRALSDAVSAVWR